MVSILSFFTKKRPKAAAADSPTRSPSPPLHPKAVSGTASRATRTKASLKERRASLDSYGFARRKSSTPAASVPVAPPRITLDLPFEIESARASIDEQGPTYGALHPRRAVRASMPGMPPSASISLGLDAVGGTPTLTPAERRVLDSQRYTPDDLRAAWEWLGREVRDRGAETVGIMLPRRFENCKDRQRQLSVLFVLARRPELADKFPSVANAYPTPAKDKAQDAWKARLIEVAKDTENPVDIAEALKAMLRRLAANARPIINPCVYIRFVQQEHAASYPRNAYATMLLPHLSTEVTGLLDAVLEVCNAIAMHAENNAMNAGRLSHLIGWWLLGKLPDGTIGWDTLYDEYKLAGQRAEHLFYARIRWQSTQQKMPRRLVQLILSYPFGESSASSEHLPLPPASTFARRVLHVALGTDAAVPSGTDPVKVLGDAIIARLDPKAESKADQWEVLRTNDGKPVTIEQLLSADSQAFLDEVSSAKGIEFTSPSQHAVPLPEDDAGYHPFARDSDRVVVSTFSDARRRSSSYGDVPRLEFGSSGTPSPNLETGTDSGSPRKSFTSNLVRFNSSTHLSAASRAPPQWDDFASHGFSDSTEAGGISLQLTKPVTPQKEIKPVLAAPKKMIVKDAAPSTNLVVVSEEVIDVDDGFIHFVEDGQLDPVASTLWPRFALVQLKEPIESDAGKVGWLLVTVKKREVRPEEEDTARAAPSLDIRSELTRPLSPSGESSMSRLSGFGFRDIANTFRRSSIYGRSHRSAFHSKSSKAEVLSPVKEQGGAGHRASSASDVPTEYTIGETGEIVKIPTALELETIMAGGTPRCSSPVVDGTAKSILATNPAQWVYLAEGGAHVVFRYTGSEPGFQGRALRLQKVPKKGSPDVAVRHAWADKLLPMVLPVHLLPESTPVSLDEKWTRALVTPTEILRQSSRRAEGPLAQIVDYSRPVQLMDNLTAPVPGETVLALEIKPKWGFLPSATNLTPHESILIKTRNCRFCLHQHYRGDLDEEDGYCPLDLYSGDQTRVRRALDSLWKAWRLSGGEKNNLRVFVNGAKVLPKDARLVPTSGESIPSGTYSLIEPLLTSSNVLSTLKKLQATLDPQDISSLAQDFAVEHPDAKLFDPALVPEATIPELTEFVMAYKRGDVNWTLRQREIAYGLSAIFKDCSIIVRAVLNAETKGYTLNANKSCVKIIDTDLKPLASLGHWAELDDKLWRHWADTKGEEKKEATHKASIREAKDSRPSTPVRSPTHSMPASPVRPITPVNETIAAAAILGTATAGAAATTLSVVTPSSSPVKPMASPVPSIPDMEDANSALARVVDPLPIPDSEILSDDDAEAPQAAKETRTLETERAEPEVQPQLATETAETREVEPLKTAEIVPAVEPKVQDAERVTEPEAAEAPAHKESAPAEPPAPVAAAAILATGPATVATIDAAPKEDAVVPAAPPPTMETLATETTLSPEPVPSDPTENGVDAEAPEATTETTPAAREITKPEAIDLSGVNDSEPAALSPVSVVDPSIDVPAEDRVDFDADPFAKAPVVLASQESRKTLSAIAMSSPTASVSGVATPVAGIPSSVGSPADTPSASVVALPPSSPERTTSRVRDRIKAFESKDTGNKAPAVSTGTKPPAMSPRRTSTVGTPKTPEQSPKAEKKPTKKNSFVAFVRKASATFDRPDKDKEEKKKEEKDKATTPAETKEKERGVNPFGSLRSKKKAAATAGAAAVAATAAVATVGLTKDDKEGDGPIEATTEAPVSEAVISDEPSAAAPTSEPVAAESATEVPATLEPADSLETVTEVSAEGPTPITEDVPSTSEDVLSTAKDVAVETPEETAAPASPVAEPAPLTTDSAETETAPETPVKHDVRTAKVPESTPSTETSGEATPVQSPNPAGLMVAEITGAPTDDSPTELDVPTSESESPGTPTPVGATFPQVASPSLFRPNSAVTPLMFEQRVSPDPAMPESAVLPKEALPVVAGSAFGLGFPPVDEHVDETDESPSAPSGLDLTFHGGESVDEFVTPAVDVEPPTPATPTPTSYFTSETKPGYSAVTPEFAGTSVLASPPSVPSPLRKVAENNENDESAADTTLVEEEAAPAPRSSTASPSPHAEQPEKKMLSRSTSVTISRSTSPVPGPPENMEMYQHASLPPLPVNKAGSIEVMEDSPIEAASNSSTELDPSAFAATTTDTPFATAPDTPAYTASESVDEDEAPALDLPELAAFTKRMADRRISANESFYEASSTATGQHPVGYAPLSDNYRTSVHTFGGTQSEAAWLNGIVKSRLSLDDARKLPENGEEASPAGTLTASSTVSEIKALAAGSPEASKDAA